MLPREWTSLTTTSSPAASSASPYACIHVSAPACWKTPTNTACATEFDQNALAYARQVALPLNYDGTLLDCGYRADIIVDDNVILELKSVEHILPLHEAQLLTYLRLSGCRIGLLLNFNTLSLKDGIRRRVL